jgi:YhcH/YjgK/YiaL family protein
MLSKYSFNLPPDDLKIMISDHLTNWRTLPGFSAHPLWTAAFKWIENNAATAEIAISELGVGGATVRVMEYATKERELARYEAHRKTIDLQYTIHGAEGIEVTPTGLLTAQGNYDASKDFQFYETPSLWEGRVDNVEGRFTILYPQDGHMPQLRVGNIPVVRKLVVKIPLSAL